MNYADFEWRQPESKSKASDGVSNRGWSARPWVVIQGGKLVSEHSTFEEACEALGASES